MFAARRNHLLQVIEPALARGGAMLCDRFTDATFAYQGGGRGFDLEVLGQLEAMVQAVDAIPAPALRQPDLTVWFDLPPAVAAARLAGARLPDKFEVAAPGLLCGGSGRLCAAPASRPRALSAHQRRSAA